MEVKGFSCYSQVGHRHKREKLPECKKQQLKTATQAHQLSYVKGGGKAPRPHKAWWTRVSSPPLSQSAACQQQKDRWKTGERRGEARWTQRCPHPLTSTTVILPPPNNSAAHSPSSSPSSINACRAPAIQISSAPPVIGLRKHSNSSPLRGLAEHQAPPGLFVFSHLHVAPMIGRVWACLMMLLWQHVALEWCDCMLALAIPNLGRE